MGRAVLLVVRWILRRHRIATVLLVLAVAFATTAVAAPLQSARRSTSSLDRFLTGSQVYDRFVQGCPPGIDPSSMESQTELITKCVNEAQAARLARIVAGLPGVERTSVGVTAVVAILDPKVANGWGRLIIGQLGGVVLPPTGEERLLMVDGRLPRVGATDEIVLGEAAAKQAGIATGDVVRLAGWSQEELDSAVDGKVPPSTPPFRSTVVGVVRTLDDVQVGGEGNLSGATLPSELYAGPAWLAAHGRGLSGYGAGVLVRLRQGEAGAPAFESLADRGPQGWSLVADPIVPTDLGSLQRVIDLERNAVLVVAGIAALAALLFVGLTIRRQVHRELVDAPTLSALGFARRDLVLVAVVRASAIAVPAVLLSAVTTVALSQFGPVGVAGRLEFVHPMRVDGWVLLVSALVTAAVVGGAAASAAAGLLRRAAGTVRRPAPGRIGVLPASAWVGVTFAWGGAARAVAVGGFLTIAAVVAASGLVASFDRLVADPDHYGARWDLVVGQYSEPGPLRDGVDLLKANPHVVAAAGLDEDTSSARVDGTDQLLLSFTPYRGRVEPLVSSGRLPVRDDEAALGAATARELHKGIGDTVEFEAELGPVRRLRVVGIIVVNDPVTSSQPAGAGMFVRPGLVRVLGVGVPQSIVVRLDDPDDPAAIASVVRDFPGSVREAMPSSDVRNISRIRAVPWAIAALVGVLALITVVNALATLLARRRKDVAVLAALGFTRVQRRRVGEVSSVVLLGVGALLGVPAGLIASRVVWRAISTSISIPAPHSAPWAVMVSGPLLLLVGGLVVAGAIGWWGTRPTPATALRVE